VRAAFFNRIISVFIAWVLDAFRNVSAFLKQEVRYGS
jgi:hypothetical protein